MTATETDASNVTTATATTITRQCVDDDRRVNHTAEIFGIHFPMRLEPCIFNMAGMLSDDYRGGCWIFYALSNGAFYMAPESIETFKVVSENGFEGSMSADALGITTCLYAYSHLSFGGDALAEVCAEQYHLLREFMLQHAEVQGILRAID